MTTSPTGGRRAQLSQAKAKHTDIRTIDEAEEVQGSDSRNDVQVNLPSQLRFDLGIKLDQRIAVAVKGNRSEFSMFDMIHPWDWEHGAWCSSSVALDELTGLSLDDLGQRRHPHPR